MHSSHASTRRRFICAALGFAGTTALAGCGFRLRGPQQLNFSSIHIGVPQYSDFGAALRSQIASNNTVIEDEPGKAEVSLQLLSDNREREILSLTGAGKVREYLLIQRIRFRLVHQDGTELIPPTNISARREYTFNDSEVLGKEQEEALLYRDMQSDLVQQIVRRLAAVGPRK